MVENTIESCMQTTVIGSMSAEQQVSQNDLRKIEGQSFRKNLCFSTSAIGPAMLDHKVKSDRLFCPRR